MIRYLVSLYLVISANVYSAEIIVIDTKGEVTIEAPNKTPPLDLFPGALIPGDWIIRGPTPAYATLLCSNNIIAIAARNQTADQVCHQPDGTPSNKLVRLRQDEQDYVPFILRPRTSRVGNLFPIQWRYSGSTGVDIFISQQHTGGPEIKLSPPENTTELIESDVDLPFDVTQSYQLRVCHKGSRSRCSDSANWGPITVLTNAELDKIEAQASLIADSANHFELPFIRAATYFSNSLYDDMNWLLTQIEHPQHHTSYLLARGYLQVGLYSAGVHKLEQLIQSAAFQNTPRDRLYKALACLTLKSAIHQKKNKESTYEQQTNSDCDS